MEFDQAVYDFCKRALSINTKDHELFNPPHPYVKDIAFCPSYGVHKNGTFITFPQFHAAPTIRSIENYQYTESFYDWPLIKFHLELIALEQSMLSI